MNGARVEAGAVVERSILDKRTRVGPGAVVGGQGSGPPNRRHPDLFHTGISLLGKDVTVSENARVGRNACVGGRHTVPAGSEVPDGGIVEGRDEELRETAPAG